MLTLDGRWDWNRFESKVPCSVLYQIAACHVTIQGRGDDICFWNGSSSGNFSVKSAYKQIMEEEGEVSGDDWRVVW